MAINVTALAEAMRVMREAVATTDEAIASIPRKKAAGDPLRYEAVGMAEANEVEAGRVLLSTLGGERVIATGATVPVEATQPMQEVLDAEEWKYMGNYDSMYRVGRALLVALDGIPERIAALEEVAVAARKLAQSCEVVADDEAPWTYSYDAVNRVYSALAALPGGVDS